MIDNPLKVVLYWHMHQPRYHDMATGEYKMPWVYLHAIKDYVAMATHLDENADAKAAVSFAPALLDQTENYALQVQGLLQQLGNESPEKLAHPLSPGKRALAAGGIMCRGLE